MDSMNNRLVNRATRPPAAPTRGFTLIELLCVVGIMVLLLSIAVGSSLGWGRASGLSGSVMNIRSSLGLARQLAATHGSNCSFVYGNLPSPARGYYVVSTNHPSTLMGETNSLPKGFIFDTATEESVTFLPNGSCTAPADVLIAVKETRPSHFLAATVTVSRATGVSTATD